jgi:hypothetical protein
MFVTEKFFGQDVKDAVREGRKIFLARTLHLTAETKIFLRRAAT